LISLVVVLALVIAGSNKTHSFLAGVVDRITISPTVLIIMAKMAVIVMMMFHVYK